MPTNGEMIAKIINQAYKLGLNDILWVGYAATESPELKNDLAFLKDVKLIFHLIRLTEIKLLVKNLDSLLMITKLSLVKFLHIILLLATMQYLSSMML